MASQSQFDLIEAYLNDELSASDRQLFEQELASNDDLRTDVDTYRSLRLGLRGLAVERRVQQAHQRYKARPSTDEAPDAKPAPPIRWGQKAARRVAFRWAVAACLLLGLGLGLYLYRQTNQPGELAYAEQSLQQDPDQLTRGLPTNLPPAERQILLAAARSYQAGQYDAVIDQLRIPAKDRASEPYRRYFLGLTYLAKEQPADAIDPLREAVGTATGPLHQKADWFLALAYLKTKQPDQARPILDRIHLDPTHPYQSLAGRLLEGKTMGTLPVQ